MFGGLHPKNKSIRYNFAGSLEDTVAPLPCKGLLERLHVFRFHDCHLAKPQSTMKVKPWTRSSTPSVQAWKTGNHYHNYNLIMVSWLAADKNTRCLVKSKNAYQLSTAREEWSVWWTEGEVQQEWVAKTRLTKEESDVVLWKSGSIYTGFLLLHLYTAG